MCLVYLLNDCHGFRVVDSLRNVSIKGNVRLVDSRIKCLLHLTMNGLIAIFAICLLQAGVPCLAQDVFNGDCLDFQAFDYFRYSPGIGYDPLKGIDGPQCAELCSESAMPHAGVVLNKYCLCAREAEIEAIKSIAKVTSELCKQSDDYVKYYKGKSKNTIENLSVKPNPEVAVIDQEVLFDISSSNTDIEYSLDYGDGSDHTEWSSANALRHRYYMSGTFVISVHARLTERPQQVITEKSSIRIEGEVMNDNVQMTCPTVVEPGDLVDCNITITMGTQLTMKMDFGDGVTTAMIDLPGKLIVSNMLQL